MSIRDMEPRPVLGETTDSISLSGLDEMREAMTLMADQARLSLKIYSQELDPDLYDDAAFLECVSELARSGRSLPVRILLRSPFKAASGGNRLVELQHRLPSCIEIRSFPHEIAEDEEEFILADNIGLLKRYTHDRLRGRCEFRSIPDAARKSRHFDSAWERAEPCHELRRLSS